MSKSIKPEYIPKTIEQKLGYFVEECGEALAAAGKSQRWGLDSVNPDLYPEYQETNAEWLLREMADVERAIGYLREVLEPTPAAEDDDPAIIRLADFDKEGMQARIHRGR